MFMGSWNVKVLVGAGLIVIQVIIYMVLMGKSNFNFNIPALVVCSIPGGIGALILWLEKNKGRY